MCDFIFRDMIVVFNVGSKSKINRDPTINSNGCAPKSNVKYNHIGDVLFGKIYSYMNLWMCVFANMRRIENTVFARLCPGILSMMTNCSYDLENMFRCLQTTSILFIAKFYSFLSGTFFRTVVVLFLESIIHHLWDENSGMENQSVFTHA